MANPCQNGGTCYVEGGEAKCNCTERKYTSVDIDILFTLILMHVGFGNVCVLV